MYPLLPYVGLFEKLCVYQCVSGVLLYDYLLTLDRASAVNLTSLKDSRRLDMYCVWIVCDMHIAGHSSTSDELSDFYVTTNLHLLDIIMDVHVLQAHSYYMDSMSLCLFV